MLDRENIEIEINGKREMSLLIDDVKPVYNCNKVFLEN